MNKQHKGMITLSLLILLTCLLLLSLLFHEQWLSVYRLFVSQRQLYVKSHLVLQQMSPKAHSICNALPLTLNEDYVQHPFRLPHTEHQQFIWCKREKLFHQLPTKAINQSKLEHYIQLENRPHFQPQLLTSLPASRRDAKVYWLRANTEWQINGNIQGIIIAEGNLRLHGKGKISGTVIVAGQLEKDQSIQISYRKSVVQDLSKQYSQWRLAEKSWYDFKAL